MQDAFEQLFDNKFVVFSIDVKQEKKDDNWKKKLSLPKEWQNSKLSLNNYNERNNGLAMVTGKPSGVIVIDIDNLEHWKSLLGERKEPKTVKAKSASGGMHLYFKYSDDMDDIKTCTHCFGKEYDIDIRTNGGCIVVPPTSYYDNNTKKYISYEWIRSIFDENLAIMPDWMLQLLRETSNNNTTSQKKSERIEKKKIIVRKNSKEDKKIEERNDNPKQKKSTSKRSRKYTTQNEDDNNEKIENLDENEDQSIDDTSNFDADEIKKLLAVISDERVHDYNDWITVGMIIYNATNGGGFSIWDEWSQTSDKYNKKECEKKWNSFKNCKERKQVTIGTLMYWCKQDNQDEYKSFKIKRKNDQMIIQKYPSMDLELGETIDVDGRKCTFLKNNTCVFTNKPHNGMKDPMYVDVYNGTMEIKCRHRDCTGRSCPCPAIKLTRNEMNMIFHGTVNVTINNNYGCSDEQLIEFQKYDIFENETVNELVYQSLTGSHDEMTELAYYYFKNDYIFGEDGNWYIYDNHRWKFSRSNSAIISEKNSAKLKSVYDELIAYGKQTKMDSEKIKSFKKIRTSFGNVQNKRDIMTDIKDKFTERKNPNGDFVKNLNSNRHLIVFNNGVYDIESQEFRDGLPEDNMSMSVGYDYKEKHTKHHKKLLKFLSDIQPDDNDRDFLLTYLSHALYGNILDWFTILTGQGRNGKSKLIELIKKTFGDFYGSVKSQMFTRPQPDANSPDPGLLSLRHKKIIITSEPEKNAKLNSGFIKFITGRDTIRLRECHKNEIMEFEPKFITMFVCNDIPDTDEMDNAFSKRLRCVNFPTEFCDDPKNSTQKQIDTKISENFDNWRVDFMLTLIDYYKKYAQTKKITITENILKWTNQYKENTDMYLNFLNECTEDSDTHCRTSTLYEAFKKWFVKNNPKTHIPSNKVFTLNIKLYKTVVKVRIGNDSVKGMKNIKPINEYASDFLEIALTESYTLNSKSIERKTNNISTIYRKLKKVPCIGIDGICPYDNKSRGEEYDNYCTLCFCHLFPGDIRVKNIKIKTKEIEVVNHVCINHEGKWYHDVPFYVSFDGGCCLTRRRIDLYQMVNGTMLCIEVDENQHKYYLKYDEFVRYNEILCDMTCKYIFIRYNPDKFKIKNKTVYVDKKTRLARLSNEINSQLDRIKFDENTDLLEIVHLFYDEK